MPSVGSQNGKRTIFSQTAPTQARDKIIWLPLDGSNNPIDGLLNWWNGSAWVKYTPPVPIYSATEHFLTLANSTTNPFGTLNLLFSASTGAPSIVSVADKLGVVGIGTSASATGRMSYATALNAFNSSGAFTYSLEYSFRLPITTTGTDTFTPAMGFLDSTTLFGSTANGCFLTTDQSNFVATNRVGGTTTQTNLAALDNLWHTYKVSFNSSGAIHTFDGVPTTIAANLPLSTSLGIVMTILKSAGTTPRTLQLDYATLAIA